MTDERPPTPEAVRLARELADRMEDELTRSELARAEADYRRGPQHPVVLRQHMTVETVEIDELLAPLIDALWAAGIDTTGSCQNWSDVATNFGWNGKACAAVILVGTPKAEAFITGSPVKIDARPKDSGLINIFFPPDAIPALTAYAEGLKSDAAPQIPSTDEGR